MKHLIGLTAAITMLFFATAKDLLAQGDAPPLIGVAAISLDAQTQAIIDGMRDRLAARGFVSGRNIAIHVRPSGPGSPKPEETIRGFADAGARIIVAITKPAIDAALEHGRRIPVVGTGLDLDSATRLSNNHRRRGLTGIAETDTHDDQFALIRLVAPEVETIAVAADPARGDIDEQLREIRASARSHDLALVPLAVSLERNAVDEAISDLDPRNTVLLLDRSLLPDAPVEALAAKATADRLRLFAADEDSVIRGAVAAMVIEPFGIGQQLGEIVADILETPSAARRPFQRARASHLVLNEDAREMIDVAAIEASIAESQRSVIDWAEDSAPRPRVKPVIPEPPPPLGVVRGITVPTPRSRPPIPER